MSIYWQLSRHCGKIQVRRRRRRRSGGGGGVGAL